MKFYQHNPTPAPSPEPDARALALTPDAVALVLARRRTCVAKSGESPSPDALARPALPGPGVTSASHALLRPPLPPPPQPLQGLSSHDDYNDDGAIRGTYLHCLHCLRSVRSPRWTSSHALQEESGGVHRSQRRSESCVAAIALAGNQAEECSPLGNNACSFLLKLMVRRTKTDAKENHNSEFDTLFSGSGGNDGSHGNIKYMFVTRTCLRKSPFIARMSSWSLSMTLSSPQITCLNPW